MEDQLDDNTLEAHLEWAEEANQCFSSIFNRVTSMLMRNVIKVEDAAFILKEASDGQGWLENFAPGKEEHQKV